MNVEVANSHYSSSGGRTFDPEKTQKYRSLWELIRQELAKEVGVISPSVQRVSQRMTTEVERVCQKSNRIQNSGQIQAWKVSLARHRLRKCLHYYRLGSQSGRVELHSNLSIIVYRYIAPTQAQLGFQARHNLLEDFLQDFYTESLKAFRRENIVPESYQPRTRLELAEYMAFTEQYGKRRITLPNGSSQQLIILRAQTFARRLPKETTVDIDQAGEWGKDEDTEGKIYTAMMQQVRSRLVSEMGDLAEEVLRDRVIKALFEYLESQGHNDCADYFALKLQDFPATEIDELLNLSPRQRDYLQQRFKYHVEKFSRSSHWRLVHQWLGADLDEKLGMTNSQWQEFVQKLSPLQRRILAGRQVRESDEETAQKLGLTLKKMQRQWTQALELAAKIRNQI